METSSSIPQASVTAPLLSASAEDDEANRVDDNRATNDYHDGVLENNLGIASKPKGDVLQNKSSVARNFFEWFIFGFVCLWGGYFVYYIFTIYLTRPVSTWGEMLTNSEYAHHPVFISLHWVGGVAILLLGPLQMIPTIRRHAPGFHRIGGYIYAGAAVFTSLFGCLYILHVGCVGGPVMNVAFFIYGLGLSFCAFMTVLRATQRRLDWHRQWALRTLVAGFSSAWYRILTIPGAVGLVSMTHMKLFLNVMAWLFFIPNMIVAELYIRQYWSVPTKTSYVHSNAKPNQRGVESPHMEATRSN